MDALMNYPCLMFFTIHDRVRRPAKRMCRAHR